MFACATRDRDPCALCLQLPASETVRVLDRRANARANSSGDMHRRIFPPRLHVLDTDRAVKLLRHCFAQLFQALLWCQRVKHEPQRQLLHIVGARAAALSPTMASTHNPNTPNPFQTPPTNSPSLFEFGR